MVKVLAKKWGEMRYQLFFQSDLKSKMSTNKSFVGANIYTGDTSQSGFTRGSLG